jgi:very-short-patch-repair endonuclease
MPSRQATQRARDLRAAHSGAERLLWGSLRNRKLGGWKWRRQVPLGPFIADFYCAEVELVVELDGGQHDEPEALAYDARRTAYLRGLRLDVLRFWNSQVFENLSGVCEEILAACGGQAPHPTLSPQERGEGF